MIRRDASPIRQRAAERGLTAIQADEPPADPYPPVVRDVVSAAKMTAAPTHWFAEPSPQPGRQARGLVAPLGTVAVRYEIGGEYPRGSPRRTSYLAREGPRRTHDSPPHVYTAAPLPHPGTLSHRDPQRAITGTRWRHENAKGRTPGQGPGDKRKRQLWGQELALDR